MYSSPTLTVPSPFQSWPGRGTNSLIAINGGGGSGVGVRVIVGVRLGVRVCVGVREIVGVTDTAQFWFLGVPLSGTPFAAVPFALTPVLVIQATSLSGMPGRRSMVPSAVEVPDTMEVPAGQGPPLELAVSTTFPEGSNKRKVSVELFKSPV